MRKTMYGTLTKSDEPTENEDTIKEITAYARLAGLKVVEGETAFNMQFMLQIMRGLEEYTNKSVNKVKTAAQAVLVKFHEDCIQVARDNLLESHVDEVGRIFAAVLIGKPYDQVTRDEVDAMLTAPEEDEDEEIY